MVSSNESVSVGDGVTDAVGRKVVVEPFRGPVCMAARSSVTVRVRVRVLVRVVVDSATAASGSARVARMVGRCIVLKI